MLPAPHRTVPPSSRPRAGVTLVEVVIAIFVLTVGVLSIIALFPAGYTLGQSALNRSVAALAARDAHARIVAASRHSGFSFPTGTLASVHQSDRVGTVDGINDHSLVCKVRGEDPSWDDDFGGCYCVITSGAAAGGVYRISSSSSDTLTFASTGSHQVTFRAGTDATAGEPVRIGDHFAIIGAPSHGDYPSTFLSGGSGRTVDIAAQGDLDKEPKDYCYGCILSPPAPDTPRLYRVDVFVYRNFQPTGEIEDQDRPVGHFVTYITRLDDYAP